jgi:hypothetical protein
MKKKLMILTILFLFSVSSYAHMDKQCKYHKTTQKIVLDGVVEQNGAFICQFEGFGLFGRSNGIQEINCSKAVVVCGGELEVGAEIWAEIITGPNPLCKKICGCFGYSEINNLLGPETCKKKLALPGKKWCEQTACGCGPGCPKQPPYEGPFCEDYLPGPLPANCVNGPNWPHKRLKLPNLFED